MTINQQQHGSATIYQFPVGGRAGLNTIHASHQAVGKTSPLLPMEYVVTDAWYHQEAIREAHQATKQ